MLLKKGIKFRLLVYVISSTIIVFGLIIFHNIYISGKFLLKNVKQNAQNITISSVNKIESKLLSIEKINQTLALYLELNDYKQEDLKKLLFNIVKNNTEVYGSCIAFEPYVFNKEKYFQSFYYYKSPKGIEFKDLNAKNYNYFLWDWYQVPKTINKANWSEPYFDKNAGNIIMSTYSVPFYKKTTKGQTLAGIVTIDVSVNWLSKIVDSIKFYKSGYAFLISNTGTIITHPNKEYILNESIFSLAEEKNKPEMAKIGKEMINGKSGLKKIIPFSNSKVSWIYYESMPSVKWSLAVVFPENELYADLNGLFLSLILISCTGLLLLILIIITIARNITYPIKQLAKATIQIGNGNFNAKLPEIMREDEISQLNRSISSMQNDLKMYILNSEEQAINKDKMLNELKIAHDIQISFLPRNYPAFPDIKSIDIHGQIETAKEVGGDLFDYFLIDEQKLCVTICDVSSFGMPASLFMAFARTVIRAKAQKSLLLKNIINEINKSLCIDNDKTFSLSMFIGVINLKNAEFEYCNANHISPVIISADKSIKLLDNHINESLGLNYETIFETDSVKLKENDLILMFTDGVTDAMNEDADFYGINRLIATSSNFTEEDTCKNISELLINDVKNFIGNTECTDDITILCIKYKA